MHESIRTIARNHACEIQLCEGCNVLHLIVGPVTVRLHPSAAHLVSRALRSALRELPPPAETATLPPSGHAVFN